jgi:hypothetical protein
LADLAAHLRQPEEPDSGIHLIWEWIEDHAWFTYPAVAVLVIGLIAGAMVSNARAQEVSAEHRGHLKMQIMGVMRRRISGVSAEAVAADLQIDIMLAAQLLADLAAEGLVSESVNPDDHTSTRYRLRSGA